MFKFFSSKPSDVKGVRNAIVQFIKEELKKNEGGEGGNIKTLKLFVRCSSSDMHIYRASLYADESDKFKREEVQRIADDFDINLPDNWKLEIIYEGDLPSGALVSTSVDVGLQIITNRTVVEIKELIAYLRPLNGETEKSIYEIKSNGGKINIGRELKVQTSEGFFRRNHIAFVNSETDVVNRTVSRQHAHIEWNMENRNFYVFADEGGVPPHNKVKVRTETGVINKIQTTELGHKLEEGDQIILGEGAVLEFSYRGDL